MNGRSGISVNPARSRVSLVGGRYNPFHHPAIPNLMRETEKTETEREIVVNMDHMSMLEFGHFLFLFLTCRFFSFFCPL